MGLKARKPGKPPARIPFIDSFCATYIIYLREAIQRRALDWCYLDAANAKKPLTILHNPVPQFALEAIKPDPEWIVLMVFPLFCWLR
jgi:hypothetical protein